MTPSTLALKESAISVVADSIVRQSLNSVWKVGAGVSLPTGSIDEEGDTPRAPGDQQLPYTMQLGFRNLGLPGLRELSEIRSRMGLGSGCQLHAAHWQE